ncbi:Putative SOS response-associated peptidase YedK [BD1-7 clade bacterium]|uniref:Abasic site processing protein n=1 Tax=BD1-7 clade bacterium TaxID=2029982 RepID=A0A5S9Q1U9_9GAMM|nr:Putative SOS response-associated peptidase YedK [BD1-7 clade bacterium]CAA0112306.1 Putative SOS response-associated peptidase YedK [BD1-7 clade bacterium]
MCGRFFVNQHSIRTAALEAFSLTLNDTCNGDILPGQKVTVITALTQEGIESPIQLDTVWGIKPAWAKQTIINAKAETVAEKPTFQLAYQTNRCVIPVNGWYECKPSADSNRQTIRYALQSRDSKPLWMAGIYYRHAPTPKLVTLTTLPTKQCAHIHDRMPLLVEEDQLLKWLSTPSEISRHPASDYRNIDLEIIEI